MSVHYIDDFNGNACGKLLKIIQERNEKPLWVYQEPVEKKIHLSFGDDVYITLNRVQDSSLISFFSTIILQYKDEFLILVGDLNKEPAFAGFKIQRALFSFDYINSVVEENSFNLQFVLPDIRAGDSTFKNVGINLNVMIDKDHSTVFTLVVPFDDVAKAINKYQNIKNCYLEAVLQIVREETDAIEEFKKDIMISETQIKNTLNNDFIKLTDSDLLLLNTLDPSVPFEKYLGKEN